MGVDALRGATAQSFRKSLSSQGFTPTISRPANTVPCFPKACAHSVRQEDNRNSRNRNRNRNRKYAPAAPTVGYQTAGGSSCRTSPASAAPPPRTAQTH
jgi:hypothetical protein